MKNHSLGKYERVFAGIAFAEMEEYDTALQLAELSSKEKANKLSTIISYLRNLYAATAFTDLFCHETALQILNHGKPKAVSRMSFHRFIEEVGLSGVRFHYVMARIS